MTEPTRSGIFDNKELERREWWSQMPISKEVILVGWITKADIERYNNVFTTGPKPEFGMYPDYNS